MLTNFYGIHRDPRFWTDPERFDPERFAEHNPPPPAAVYCPFGFGALVLLSCAMAGD